MYIATVAMVTVFAEQYYYTFVAVTVLTPLSFYMTNTLLKLVSVLATLTTQLYTIDGAGRVTLAFIQVTKCTHCHTIQMSWQWPMHAAPSHVR